MQLDYFLEGVNFKDYGVYVSASKGLIGLPKLKQKKMHQWDDEHGEGVDFHRKFYQARNIELKCFIKADSVQEFLNQARSFQEVFSKPGLQRLQLQIENTKPLFYLVYQKDGILYDKAWNDRLMIGEFTLKLVEPEPIKRVLRCTERKVNFSIQTTLGKEYFVSWGDGTTDTINTSIANSLKHTYSAEKEHYIILCGDIGDIQRLTGNITEVWNKL